MSSPDLDRSPEEDPYEVFVRLWCQCRWSEAELVEMGRRTGMRLGRRDFRILVQVMRQRMLDHGLVEEG